MENPLDMNIDKFKPKEAELKAKAEKYKVLKIDGIEDKEGFKKVYEARMEIRSDRIEVDKFFDAINDGYNLKKKEAKEKYEEIVKPLKEVESILKEQEDKITVEKERIKKEEEERKAKKIQDRMDRLKSVNYYDFTLVELNLVKDEDFEALFQEKKKIYDIKQKEADDLAEKIRKEKLQEEEDLKKKQEELDARQKKLDEDEARIKKEKEEISKPDINDIPEIKTSVPDEVIKTESAPIADKVNSEVIKASIPERKIKRISFVDFLQDQHGKYYSGLDDNMPDAYDNWLSELDDHILEEYFGEYIGWDSVDTNIRTKYIEFIRSLTM